MRDYTDGPAPGFWRLWWNMGALFPAVFALVFLIMTALSFVSLHAGLAFDADGVAVTAEVADRRTKQVVRDGKTETDHYVTLRYFASDEVVAIEKRVSRSVYEQSVPGGYRDIRHMPQDPRQVEFTIGETWREGQLLRWIALAAGLVALIGFWRTARPVADALLARRFGPAETARILSVDRHKTKHDYLYAIRFFGSDKREHTSLWSGDQRRYDAAQPGAEVEVFQSL